MNALFEAVFDREKKLLSIGGDCAEMEGIAYPSAS
jgi:hypothetical protein